MEPNQSTPQNSDDATTTTTGEEQHNQQISRSYECTFCKRGFTNAQALGGHMNIHRKHKATLTFSPPPNAAATTTTINPFSNSGQGKNKPLRLFGDGSSDSRNINHDHQGNVMKDQLSPAHELDLELRLGQVESPGNYKISTTRKFF